MEQEQLLALVKQLADSYLRQRALIEELKGRLGRVEHVMTVDAVARQTLPQPSQSAVYCQRDIMGE